MAQGQNAKKYGNRGKEWWGKRPYSGTSVSPYAGIMKFYKRQVHKVERAVAKKECNLL